MKKSNFVNYLKNDEFEDLFIDLGWNDYDGDKLLYPAKVDETDFDFIIVAQQSGFMVLKCAVNELPSTALYKKLDTQIRPSAHDYICIYYVPGQMKQMWIVPVNKVDKRDIVSVKYENAAHAEFLYEKVEGFTFKIGTRTTIMDVKERVQKAFIVNSEKVTKKFYTEFKRQHKSFEKYVSGISYADDVRWYTSIMLDRLMFCYFIQKKGFLDADKNYLQDKLKETKDEEGEDEFYAFYRDFLCQLFHDGLNTPHHDTPEFLHKFGRIPYLNGGMFDKHELEKKYPNIQIKDKAFEDLFNFFDQWEWHLDTRMTASGKDINPDVLGYIFEQFINDRAQMGAYYTKEDITGYIGRNCIVPFLFDKMKEKMPAFFRKGGRVWEFLRTSGDRYIYDAVKKGYSADWRERIPQDIAEGLDTTQPNLLERRSHWNDPTPDEFGLPTEIWRETIERLQRCEELLKKIGNGEIVDINDLITYNLDIRQFAYDLLEQTDSHDYVRYFYHALQHITILDPTCGSGAFLFAAMNILEPLYEICIARMQQFNKENEHLFCDELGEIANKYRSNIQYFIYKSIILRNLYGVDIMAEAIEIAKLRLFLKMVAVVDVNMKADNLGLDPLPDIDFNIKCGNTLVGYATEKQLDDSITFGDMFARLEFKERIQKKLEIISKTYETFKDLQMNQQDDQLAFKKAKMELRKEQESLNEVLNQHLYGHQPDLGYGPWLQRTQPFHWVAEFYEIMHNGGFDVIIGNPPYVVYNKKDKKTGLSVSDQYKVNGYKSLSCNNLYAFCIERCYQISGSGRIGMIVPLSLSASVNMHPLRNIITENACVYVSSYEIRPAKLFDGGKGADQRLNIFIAHKDQVNKLFTTQVLRWKSENRNLLFPTITYCLSVVDERFLRFSSPIEKSIYEKLHSNCQSGINTTSILDKANLVHYRSAGLRYWIIFLCGGFGTDSKSNKCKAFKSKEYAKYYMAAYNSNLFWWYYATNFDMFNLTDSNILEFPLDYDTSIKLGTLSQELEDDLNKNKVDLTTNKNDGDVNFSYAFQKKLSKPIVDRIDTVLAKHYGFTDEELDFIINYNVKYRMGEELNNDSE